MVLEFLDGQTLSERVRAAGRLTPVQVAPLARQILKGLGAAHNAGIVHRDLKPDNIFILKEKAGNTDYVKIIDFGISKFQPLAGDGMKMTSTGAVMGTPYYMSPEQASGSRNADARSDLYAVGVILYECVTGRVPFEGETFNQLMFKIVLQDPPSPCTNLVPDLDPAFSSIILKAMARDMNQRFQTAAEFSSAIGAWVERGAKVSIPPSPSSEAMVPGATRGALASVAGMMAPTNATRSGSTGASTWATSQVGLAPAKNNTMVIASIAGGLGFAALIAGFVLFHGGNHAAASAEPSVQPPVAAAAVPAAMPPAVTPEPVVAPVVPAPAAPVVADKPGDTSKKDDSEPKAAVAAATKAAPSPRSSTPAKSSAKHAKADSKAGAPDSRY